MAWKIMAILVLVKIASVSITIGSGGSGGIFAPSLFIGAMLGGAVGTAIHAIWPESTASPGAYALVGKSAAVLGPILFGEVSRAFGGNQRPAILSVVIFFIIGLFFVTRVQVPKRSGKTASSEA